MPEAFRLIEGHSKIKAALSHPSFDFWLYLHFNLYDVPQGGSNAQIHSLLSQCDGFSGFGPRDKKITERRAKASQDRIKIAVNNARILDKRCVSRRCVHESGSKTRCELLDRDPSSGMWRLLESLGVLPALK